MWVDFLSLQEGPHLFSGHVRPASAEQHSPPGHQLGDVLKGHLVIYAVRCTHRTDGRSAIDSHGSFQQPNRLKLELRKKYWKAREKQLKATIIMAEPQRG
jgi:hypothetical protein